MLLLTAFVDVTSVILLYRITLQTSILNGISESGTPATYADMLLIIIIHVYKKQSHTVSAKVMTSAVKNVKEGEELHVHVHVNEIGFYRLTLLLDRKFLLQSAKCENNNGQRTQRIQM